MKDSDFDRAELLELIGEVLEGSPDEATRERLRAILKEHREARDIYRQHMELHAHLSFDYTGGLGVEAMPGDQRMEITGDSGKESRSSGSLLLMAALILASLLVLTLLEFRSGTEFDAPLAANGVAVMSRSLDAQWEDGPHFQEGDTIGKGRIKLKSGLVEIEFLSGASAIVEGPADLELVSEDLAICHEGKLRVFVPEPAKGFTIAAPRFDAVDLGTEFAISVENSGRSEVHVIDGQVDLHGKDGSLLRNLHAGDAAGQESQVGELESMSADGGRFVNWKQLAELKGQHSISRYEDWRNYRSRWAEDPDSILYFDFENQSPWERQLRNARSGQPDGGIVGAQWVSGRWPEKSALEFKRTSDRVRLDVSGEWSSISFAAWIRVEGLDRRHNALFLSDEWNRGETHWHIGEGGSLNFAINSVGRAKTEPLLGPSFLGRWIHIAVTFDSGKNLISHYLNGRLVSSGETRNSGSIVVGEAEIGNWKPHDRGHEKAELRSFNGRIDELLVLGRIMSDSEILEHYEKGDPYR